MKLQHYFILAAATLSSAISGQTPERPVAQGAAVQITNGDSRIYLQNSTGTIWEYSEDRDGFQTDSRPLVSPPMVASNSPIAAVAWSSSGTWAAINIYYFCNQRSPGTGNTAVQICEKCWRSWADWFDGGLNAEFFEAREDWPLLYAVTTGEALNGDTTIKVGYANPTSQDGASDLCEAVWHNGWSNTC